MNQMKKNSLTRCINALVVDVDKYSKLKVIPNSQSDLVISFQVIS